jgi:hypothetical protein
VWLILLVIVGVIIFLEGCFTAIPKEHHKVPRQLVWLLELPILLALFIPATNKMGFVWMPLIVFSLSVVINSIVYMGLVLSYRPYMKEIGANGIWMGFVAAGAVCGWPFILVAGTICAIIWKAKHPYETAEWAEFMLSPFASLVIPVVLYGVFLAVMSMLKQKVQAVIRKTKQIASAKPKRKAEPKETTGMQETE